MKSMSRFHFALAAMIQRISSSLRTATDLVSDLFAASNGVNSRWQLRFLPFAVPGLLLLLGPALVWGGSLISTSFRGVATILSTGGAILSSPLGVAVDSQGNVYIADNANNRVVEVNAAGTQSVLSFPGLSPALVGPRAVAVDGSGNLYVTDGSQRVIELSGGVASVIPTASLLASPFGLALDAAGNLYISDQSHSYIVKVPAGGGAAAVLTITGLATALNTPDGLAVDSSGNLYIADQNINRIVKVTPGGVGSALAITGGLTLNTPQSVAVDQLGNVYVADYGNNRVVSVAPGGLATVLSLGSTTLSHPRSVAVGAFGTIYIADTTNNRVVEAQPTAVGFGHLPLGTTSGTTLTLPFTVASGTTLSSVQVFTQGTPNLDFTVISPPPTCGVISQNVPNVTCPNISEIPVNVGNCVAGVTNTSCNLVVQFLPTAPGLRRGAVVLFNNATPPAPILTVPLYAFADSPVAALSPGPASVLSTGEAVTANPYELALDGAGNMYVGDYTGKNVMRIVAEGGSASVVSLGTPGGTSVQNITGVALDGAGNLFIGDHQNSRIVVVTPGGVVSVLTINGLSTALGFPTALAVDSAGNLFIADYTGGRVVEVSTLLILGSTSSGNGTVVNTGSFSFAGSMLTGMTVDGKDNLYLAAQTQNNSNIIKVTAAGVSSALTIPSNITPAISNPQGVGVDAMGNIYIVDTGNSRIVRITNAGVASIFSISGLTSPTTLGSTLFGVTSDPFGNIFILDWTNNRIVEVNVSGATLAFANSKVGFTSADSPKTATVTNLGNQPLLISANPTYTLDFSENTGDENVCTSSSSLDTGTVCDVSVLFTPQSIASLSASIPLTNNTLNNAGSTQQVSVSGTGTNPGDTTAVAVSASLTSVSIGQPITLTATVTDTTAGNASTVPTGNVTFSDSVGCTTVLLNSGNPVTLVAGVASLTGATLAGTGSHTITAIYNGVSGSFTSSTNRTSVTVSKDAVTITGPVSQPVSVGVGQAGSVLATIAGPYTVVTLPSGSLAYTIFNSTNTSVGSGTALLTSEEINSAATIPIANTLLAGNYTVSVTYVGDTNYSASESATTIQVSIGKATPTITWPQPSVMIYGTSLGSVLNASAASGVTSVPGSFAYTASLPGGSAVAVSSNTILGAGSYTLSVAFTPTDTNTYNTAAGTVSLTVAQATPVVSLSSSLTIVLLKNAVTFTANVSSVGVTPTSVKFLNQATIGGTPTGSVTFLDGTTSLGSGTLTQGVATLTTSTLSTGPHTITAQYGGSTNFVAQTSSPVTVTVDDFSLNLAAGGISSVTVAKGGTATYPLVIGPTAGSTFPAVIALSVSGFPSGAIATLTPNTLAAGGATTNVSLTVQVPNQTASLGQNQIIALRLSSMMFGVMLLPFAGKIRRAAGRRVPFALLLLLALLVTSLAALSGCATKNSGFLGNSSTNFTLTVTGTSGPLSHSTTVNLTVQ